MTHRLRSNVDLPRPREAESGPGDPSPRGARGARLQVARWLAPLLLGATVAGSGCALLSNIVKSRDHAKTNDLEAAGDYDALSEHCAAGHSDACEATTRVGRARLDASSCDTLVDDLEKYYVNSEGTTEGDLALVERFESCGKLPDLFASDLRIRWLSESLVEADRGGTEVFEPFVAYLGSGADLYRGDGGAYHAERLARWLVDMGDASRCEPIAGRMDAIADESKGEFVWMFYELGCGPQALPFGKEFIRAEDPGRRIQGCDVLGKFGDATMLEDLETLAKTDPYKVEREVQTASGLVAVELVHPVRERCLAAAGKVRLGS